ncbi:glycosyltransferase family 4 protein [Bacteroides difficilis]|uniref:Glycosyltransferase family 4 protein n=1 Tax=Bacteroides difficilis TaxID=2763021 RepID=A0ABR7CCP3_9BACE|nr:glycosyltransferase family 4 protein [Bacteroides difficilis]MBC5605566.1 glycosyltransferase family 4 protein [Bacteroides difficilis]
MKILQVASGNFFSTYGGGQVYMKNIVDEMIRQQRSLIVFSFLDNSNGIEKKNYKGIDLYEIKNVERNELQQLIQAIRPDIIHAHSQKALMCTIGQALHIPVIITAHHGGIVCPAGALLNFKDEICNVSASHTNCLPCVLRNTRSGMYWYPFMKQLAMEQYISLGEKLKTKPFIPFITPIGQAALFINCKQKEWQNIVEGCTRMIAPCHAIKEAMMHNGLDEKKIIVIPHGIPLPVNAYSLSSIENGRIRFFYVGRICYVKGIHVLLQAFSRLAEDNVELHLIGGAGNKGEYRYMAQLQRKYKKDSRIIWHGKVEPEYVFNEIKDMHVSVAVSICMEIFGLNIAEALAMGKLVLATRCGGAEMQIEDGVNGWLVSPNNVKALKTKMEDIISNVSVIPSMGMAGRKSVISIEEHCKTLVNLYKRVNCEKEETSH